ncbi:hypothetical protein [Conchiformibius kuhniae]|uniref:Uncharacterized protein n=1 Tax=Conchiformibius kuhniae TaxID=211502 RepID=A0A8T9MSQ8_9NEIS|nr:hypothetical protein [Conchiformibius kuhniae]UOP04311.1 hypothetical protein LVJ77_08020 [Conchiformibius kuhniae]
MLNTKELFQLVQTWEGNPDEYAAYFLYKKLKEDGCVNADGKVELIQRSGMFCPAPSPHSREDLGKRIRARIININRISEIYCQIHCLTCINFQKEEEVARRKHTRQQDLLANQSILSDREREELLYLNRWLHDRKERSYFTQYDEYVQEYCIKMYKVFLSDAESFLVPKNDVMKIVGEELLLQLSEKPLNSSS